MKEYRRSNYDLETKVNSLEDNLEMKTNQLNTVYKHWIVLLTELNLSLPKLSDCNDLESALGFNDLFLKEISKFTDIEKESFKNDIDILLEKNWKKFRKNLEDVIATKSLKSESNAMEVKFDKLKSKYHKATTEMATLKPELLQKEEQIKKLTGDLDQVGLKLQRKEKKIDRLQLYIKDLLKNQSSGQLTTEDTKNLVNSETKDQDLKDVSLNNAKVEEFEILSNMRLKEIEQLRSEKTLAIQQADHYKTQLIGFEDRDPSLFATLQIQVDELKKTNADLKERCATYEKNNTAFESERRKFKEIMMLEEKTRLNEHKKYLDFQNQENNHLRTSRDEAVNQLQLEQSKLQVEFDQINELRILANSRKDRIKALESECRRMKLACAQECSDKELIQFFLEKGVDASIYENLKSKLAECEKKCRENELLIKSFEKDSAEKDIILENASLKSKIGDLEENLKKLKNFYEINFEENEIKDLLKSLHKKPTPNDEDLILKSLSLNFKKEKLRREDLEAKNIILEKSKEVFCQEINSLVSGFSTLEEQNTRKVLNLTEKETQIAKLNTDKAELSVKVRDCKKREENLNNQLTNLKKMMEKQLESIRNAEEREKLLTHQIQLLEKTVIVENQSVDVYKQKLDQANLSFKELQVNVEKLTLRLNEITAILHEKTKIVNLEQGEKNRLKEELEIKKKNLELLEKKNLGLHQELNGGNNNSTSAEIMELKEQLDDYKKSHVLLRCMHTFCKGCVDNLTQSRQRKCPTCGLVFSLSDIKE
ncbi:E3 ubiquitin-protein ligase bre1, partial [Clydaea vesicula]